MSGFNFSEVSSLEEIRESLGQEADTLVPSASPIVAGTGRTSQIRSSSENVLGSGRGSGQRREFSVSPPTAALQALQISSTGPPRELPSRGLTPAPWMHHQRPHTQSYDPHVSMHLGGQIPYYGWYSPPLGMGYQMMEGQRPPMFVEGGYSGVMSYPFLYPGTSEMPHHQFAGPGFRPQMLGGPFFPTASMPPMNRGRPHRVVRPAESSETYDFDMSECTHSPETAKRTLMLRNIPNKYTIHMLLEMLDKSQSKEPNELVYDFCYLPIDFKNRCNLGYAFVNFVDAKSAVDCYTAFHNKRWNDFNSKKVCEVKYARVQGREALIEHFRNSKFPSNDIDSLPLLFEKSQSESGEAIVQSVPLHSRHGA